MSNTNPSHGPRSSSNPRKPSNIRGSQRFTSWPAIAVGLAGSTALFGTARAVSASSGTRGFTGSRSTIGRVSAVRTYPWVSPNAGPTWLGVWLKTTDDRLGHARASLAMALGLTGAYDEAIVLTDGLVATAESTHNPYLALRTRLSPSDWSSVTPIRRSHLRPYRRATEIAQASGNRFGESHIAVVAVPARSTTRLPGSRVPTTSRWRSATTLTRETSRHRAARWPSSRACYANSATMNRLPPSPTSPTTR